MWPSQRDTVGMSTPARPQLLNAVAAVALGVVGKTVVVVQVLLVKLVSFVEGQGSANLAALAGLFSYEVPEL